MSEVNVSDELHQVKAKVEEIDGVVRDLASKNYVHGLLDPIRAGMQAMTTQVTSLATSMNLLAQNVKTANDNVAETNKQVTDVFQLAKDAIAKGNGHADELHELKKKIEQDAAAEVARERELRITQLERANEAARPINKLRRAAMIALWISYIVGCAMLVISVLFVITPHIGAAISALAVAHKP